jgi:hypothetical protein
VETTFSKAAADLTDAGSYRVRVSNPVGTATSGSAFVAVYQVGVLPENDLFADAVTLTGTSGRVVGLETTAASGESGEPDHAGLSAPLNSLWWRYTAPVDGALLLDTFGSDFDTTLAAYSGSTVGGLLELASNDDSGGRQSSLTLPLSAGDTVSIAVDGYSDATGSVVLNYVMDESFTPAPNDDFADRELLDLQPGGMAQILRTVGNNLAATSEMNEPVHLNAAFPNTSVWFEFVAPEDGRVAIDLGGSGFDTLLAVYTGTGVGALAEVASNDDSPRAGLASGTNFQVDGGVSYKIAVAGYFGDTGQIELELSYAPNGPQTLVQATEASYYDWQSGGAVGWFLDDEIHHDGTDAAVSALVGAGETSSFLAEFEGPGTVGFWCRLDTESGSDRFLVRRNGSPVLDLDGSLDWQYQQLSLPAGNQMLEFVYQKDQATFGGSESVWVDEILFTPDPVPYASWISGFFPGITDPGIVAADGDADGDGRSNLLEYFFGSRPDVVNASSLFEAVQPLADGACLFRFHRNRSRAGLVQNNRWSSDLNRFHASGESDGGSQSVTLTERVLDRANPDTELVEITATPSRGTPDKLFLQVEVVEE